MNKLRDHKAFAKKLSRALGRGDWSSAKSLENNKPLYRLDHIIKERYVSETMSVCFLTFLPPDTRLSLMLCEISTMPCAWYFSFPPYHPTLVFPLTSLRIVRDFLRSGSYMLCTRMLCGKFFYPSRVFITKLRLWTNQSLGWCHISLLKMYVAFIIHLH